MPGIPAEPALLARSGTLNGPLALCYHFGEPPALQLGQRAGFNDSYCVALLRFAFLVMSVKFLGNPDNAVIQLVLHHARNLHDNCFFHLRAGHDAGNFLAFVTGAYGCGCGFVLGCHYAFLNSRSRRSVFTRARSLRADRSLVTASACPVES